MIKNPVTLWEIPGLSSRRRSVNASHASAHRVLAVSGVLMRASLPSPATCMLVRLNGLRELRAYRFLLTNSRHGESFVDHSVYPVAGQLPSCFDSNVAVYY